jgi:hypothetical protein
MRDGTMALRRRIWSVTYRNNELRGLWQTATQVQQLGGVSILLLFQAWSIKDFSVDLTFSPFVRIHSSYIIGSCLAHS